MTGRLLVIGVALAAALRPCVVPARAADEPSRPNVLVILADDLGFSDLGAYGGEIDTPNLDRLAAGGLRFTQGYNTARCWPTRAALLTGYYPQAIHRDALSGGQGGVEGRRPAWAKLLPERLAAAGYRSYHSGKWHIDGDPRAQGFARSLDVLGAGQSNFFDPRGVTDDGNPFTAGDDFYVTTSIGTHAVKCLAEHARDHAGTPFFHYVAFTAPHFPVQAPADVVAKYRERYLAGWDAVRAARAARLRESGIVTTPPADPEPDVGPPYQPKPETLARLGPGEVDRPHPWDSLTAEQREFQATKMAIHAAMVDIMDREVGRILHQLEAMRALDDTFILFLSDNGASAEIMIRGEGHDPTAAPGSRKTFLCLGPGWSTAANAPFRRHKTWVHEGGIATPWIVHWPKGITAKGELRRQPVHAIDVVPTVLEISRVPEQQAESAPPLHGRSFAATLASADAPPAHESLWWCHDGHRAVRMGDWKLVAVKGGPWELYDLASDRCETRNLAESQPDRVAALEREWSRIAAECRGLAAAEMAPAGRPTSAPAKAAGSRKPPNVVIVFADDLGYGDLGCYGGTAAATPAIDALARAGLRFTDFHVAQAVCSASRAALLTGCYPNRIGISGALGPSARHGISAEETTLAELLRDRGYRTAAIGKWHLGHHPPFLPTRHGFDEYFGLPYSNDMWPHHPEAKAGGFPPLPLFDGETIVDADVTPEDQATLTARYASRAVEFIERAGTAADGRPFFLYLAHSMPHVPLFAGAEFRGKNPGGPYGDVLAEIDASVAAVLAALDRSGHADDTLVIVTSDNGPWLSYGNHAGSAGPLREGKGTSFEGGVRVPCVARLPGVIPPGTVCNAPAMTIDLVPTIAALTGEPLSTDADGHLLAAGRRIDGRDVGPLFRGQPADATNPPVSFFWYADNQLQAVREGRWKLFLPHTARTMAGQPPGKDGIPGTYRPLPVGLELYDLATDPGESRDVAAEHPEVVKRLEMLAEQARADLGDSLTKRQGANMRPAGALRESAAVARPPNIVFFLCDDLGTGDVGALGGKDIQTPNIDALFARGTILTRHWAGNAVCAPSRCVLLTGKHPGHAVVRSNREVKPEGQFPMPAGTVTLARILRDAGYATGGFGKWGLGAPGGVSDPAACGFDRFYGYNCQREAHTFYPGHLWSDRERVVLDNPARSGDPQVARGGTVPAAAATDEAAYAKFTGTRYSADLIAAEQLAFIRAHATRPFFLYVPTTLPHLGLQVPADEPSLAGYREHFGDEEPYLGGRGYVPCRRPLATYAAMVTRMDREVGRIVRLLEDLGLTDDTIFVFTSDNGATSPGTGGIDTARLKSNGDLRDWKGSPSEGGLRVPTAIVWPGRIPAGGTLDTPTGFEDWMPTLLDLARLHDRIPADVDGVSLAEALEGKAAPPADRFLYRELTEGRWQAVTEGRWKAVRRAAGPKEPERAGPTELFDLSVDPAESTDVAAKHPDEVARLEALMDREHVPHPDWPLRFADAASRRAGARPAAAERPAAATPAKRPNILFIVADDQSPFDLEVYEPASRLETPVLDALAARGCVLDAAYHMGSFSGAVCTPSRHMIMTGRTLWHLPIGPGARNCPADIEDHVLAAVFNVAGYDTMRTCKEGNSYEAANRRFTVRHDATKRAGTAAGGSAWHADRVLDFLVAREAAGDTDPFLIFYGFSHPHDTRDGTPELLATYGATNHTDPSRPPPLDARQPRLPANWLPAHPFDTTHLDVRDEGAVSGVWRRRDEATIRNEIGREFACSANIDIQIGRVLDKLRAMGELDNTWIVYTADHGIAIGRHGLQGKQNLYEHTWRVPLIVAGPGVKPGSRAPGNVYLGDVLATLCDIAGIAPPATNEGTSFLPVLRGEKAAIREVLYGAYSGGAKPGIRCVRRGDWKLVKYESPSGGLVTQLFNLRQNPEEFLAEHHDPAVTAVSRAAPTATQKNLADDPAHAAQRRELEALLLAEMERLHDPHRFSDQTSGPTHP